MIAVCVVIANGVKEKYIAVPLIMGTAVRSVYIHIFRCLKVDVEVDGYALGEAGPPHLLVSLHSICSYAY